MKEELKRAKCQRHIALENAFNIIDAFAIPSLNPDQFNDYTDIKEGAIKGFIEMNIMTLFESAQITFRFTTEEDLAKSKQDIVKETKKLIVEN